MARKGQITFEKLNSLFKALLILDSDKRDYRISKVEYESIKDKQNILKDLIGNRKFDSWDTFKTAFIDNQNQYNVIWKQAQGGSLYLEEILLTEDLGYEIAIKLLDKVDIKDGEQNLFKYFKEFLPDLFLYIEENLSYLTLNDFKEGFKAADKKNYSFKFKQGRNSTTFIKTLNTYTYLNKEGSQDEIHLGNEILDKLKSRVGLDRLDHNQTERSGGKYQNYDFTGYKRKITPFNDLIDIYSFELKPSNKIEYISDSISQATNYRSTSNYVYIIIPMFDKKLFHDEERFETYYELCKTNKIGIITIELDTSKHKILDVYEVLPPQRNEITDFNLLESILFENKLEFCPLCRKIAINDEERKGCGWLSSRDSKCMKRVFEERLVM